MSCVSVEKYCWVCTLHANTHARQAHALQYNMQKSNRWNKKKPWYHALWECMFHPIVKEKHMREKWNPEFSFLLCQVNYLKIWDFYDLQIYANMQ